MTSLSPDMFPLTPKLRRWLAALEATTEWDGRRRRRWRHVLGWIERYHQHLSRLAEYSGTLDDFNLKQRIEAAVSLRRKQLNELEAALLAEAPTGEPMADRYRLARARRRLDETEMAERRLLEVLENPHT